MATLRYDVDVDTRQAERRIGAFALGMRQRITQAVRSLPEIELGADATDAQRELQRIRAELVALGRQRIGVDIDATTAQAKLEELNAQLVALQASSGDVQIDADTAAAVAALRLVEEQVSELDGRRAEVKIDVDKSLADSIIKVAALGRALGTIMLPVAAVNIIPVIGAIASSIGDLTGVAGLLPAVLIAGGLAVGTLKVGMQGFGDALKALGKGDLENFNAQVGKMAPQAREAAQAIAGLKPAWDSLRLDVQNHLFAETGLRITALGKTYLPILRKGMVAVADSFNSAGHDVADFLQTSQGIADVRTLVDNSAKSVKALSPALVNVVAGLTDVGVVGSTFLPELAEGATKLTGRFREFIAEARQSGRLAEWIQTGIDKVAQLGRVVGNTGGALGAFFSAANKSGSDFLDTAEKLSAELEKLVKSDPAQAGITAFFRETGAAIDAALPGVRGFATALFEAVSAAANTGGLRAAGQAITDILNAVTPLLPALGKLAGETLRGLATTASAVAVPLRAIVTAARAVLDALGPIGPALVGMAIGFKVLGPLTGLVTGLGTSLAGLAGRMGASEAATGRIATAFSKVGAAIPIAGAALIGLGILYDQLRDKANDLAQSVTSGSMSVAAAVKAEQASYEGFWGFIKANNGITEQATGQAFAQAHAFEKVSAAVEAAIQKMSPYEALQARVQVSQSNLNDKVTEFGPTSKQAADAAAVLARDEANLKAASDGAAQSQKSLGDEIVKTSQAASAAANADVAYQQAVLNVASANEHAAKVAGDRTSSENDLKQANLQVMQANLAAADSARRLAEADATASGATNVAEIGAQAYKDELIRLAGQATGPTRQALLNMAAGTNVAKQASATAEVQARLHKDELGRLGAQANGPLAAAMAAARRNFDTLGGAHATAEQRARAQKDELGRLANMASGPLRTELLRMAAQINSLPSKTVTVTADGRYGKIVGGVAAFASGGVMPGYSPGRDNLSFMGPTGRLDLSGGEAVMRPEWTRAVSPRYVHAANKAARTGGVAGVQDFLARTAPRPGEGRIGDGSAFANGGIYRQRFAAGGLVRTGPGYPEMARTVWERVTNAMAAQMAPVVAARLRAMAAGGVAGPTTVAAARALAFARTQVGKPYTWSAVGPYGYDCSGFISALVNVMRGRYPYSRVGSTGTFPWAGFAPGLGAGLNVGAFRGFPGHMAGTIGGVNVESNGSQGVVVGGRTGAGSSMFNIRAHLADRGAMIPSGHAGVNLSGMPERMLSPAQTRAYDSRPTSITNNVQVTLPSSLTAMTSVDKRKLAVEIRQELDSLTRSRS